MNTNLRRFTIATYMLLITGFFIAATVALGFLPAIFITAGLLAFAEYIYCVSI